MNQKIELASKVEQLERVLIKALKVEIRDHDYRNARLEVTAILRRFAMDERQFPQEKA